MADRQRVEADADREIQFFLDLTNDTLLERLTLFTSAPRKFPVAAEVRIGRTPGNQDELAATNDSGGHLKAGLPGYVQRPAPRAAAPASASSSLRSVWVMRIEQNFGPHIEQNLADL